MVEALVTQLLILKLSDLKPNFSDLARNYGIDRRTIKKYYDGYSGKPANHNKPSMYDGLEPVIRAKLSLKGSKVKAVYEYLRDKYGDVGTYSNFNKYVNRKGLKPSKSEKGHPRYETEPGKQAQVDWKEDVTLYNRHHEKFTIQVFNYKLGYSRYSHYCLKLFKTRQDVFDCLIESFKATGGVPEEILFDNMKSVVDRDGDYFKIWPQCLAFAKDFGFKLKLCKSRHPFTKGKVEADNKFIDWLIPYDGEFEDENDLMEILARINKTANEELCQETGVPPILLFQKEKEYLMPMPKADIIETYLRHDRQTTVRKDSMITYMSNKYSVPPEYIGKPVTLQIRDDILYIYSNTEIVAQHRLSTKKLNYQKEHYEKLLSGYISDNDSVAEIAKKNLQIMDNFL